MPEWQGGKSQVFCNTIVKYALYASAFLGVVPLFFPAKWKRPRRRQSPPEFRHEPH